MNNVWLQLLSFAANLRTHQQVRKKGKMLDLLFVRQRLLLVFIFVTVLSLELVSLESYGSQFLIRNIKSS